MNRLMVLAVALLLAATSQPARADTATEENLKPDGKLAPLTGSGFSKPLGEAYAHVEALAPRIDGARKAGDARALAGAAVELALAETLSGKKPAGVTASGLLSEAAEAARRAADSETMAKLAGLWTARPLGFNEPSKGAELRRAAARVADEKAKASRRVRAECACKVTIGSRRKDTVRVTVNGADGMAQSKPLSGGEKLEFPLPHCEMMFYYHIVADDGSFWSGGRTIPCGSDWKMNLPSE